jgi:glyoxylate/hydroxypyruvate reductase A
VVQIVLTVAANDEATWLPLARAALPGADVVLRPPETPVDPHARMADYALQSHPCSTLYREQRSLRATFAMTAGVGWLLREPSLPWALPVIRLEDAGMTAQMIRYVEAAVLRVLLNLPTYAHRQRRRVWEQEPPRSPATMTIGVLGIGVIGAEIARKLAGSGFRVRGFARSSKAIPGVTCLHGDDQFDAFLRGLDVLVNVLPLTAANRGILDRRALGLLADGAHVINIGRGAHLVEDDLLALLDSGKLAGATLDVFDTEPLPARHPYWQRPDVVLTPHVSGSTIADEAFAQVATKIAALARGEPVTGVVDRSRGY